jgi:hypothetical protein
MPEGSARPALTAEASITRRCRAALREHRRRPAAA